MQASTHRQDTRHSTTQAVAQLTRTPRHTQEEQTVAQQRRGAGSCWQPWAWRPSPLRLSPGPSPVKPYLAWWLSRAAHLVLNKGLLKGVSQLLCHRLVPVQGQGVGAADVHGPVPTHHQPGGLGPVNSCQVRQHKCVLLAACGEGRWSGGNGAHVCVRRERGTRQMVG